MWRAQPTFLRSDLQSRGEFASMGACRIARVADLHWRYRFPMRWAPLTDIDWRHVRWQGPGLVTRLMSAPLPASPPFQDVRHVPAVHKSAPQLLRHHHYHHHYHTVPPQREATLQNEFRLPTSIFISIFRLLKGSATRPPGLGCLVNLARAALFCLTLCQ